MIGYDAPVWQADRSRLWVDNIAVDGNIKTVWVEVKFAVMVPVPLIVAVVDAEVVLVKVMEPVLLDQFPKKYPELGAAVIEREPELKYPLAWLIEPLPEGFTANDT